MSYLSGVRNRLWSNERGSKVELERASPADAVMIARLEDGYGFVHVGNTAKNVEIAKKYKLGFIWNWLWGNEDFSGFAKILGDSKSATKTRNGYTFYTSQNRNMVLSMLGWPEIEKYKPSKLKDRSSSSALRSTLISLCNFDLQSSIEFVKEVKSEERLLYSILSSFTFDTSKSSTPKLSSQLSYSTQSYTSAILLFLSGGSDFTKVFEKLPFPDNIGFSCIFFSDTQLKKSLKRLTETFRNAGDLNAVTISGFDSSGIETIERYLELTEDIQTVGLISITCKNLNIPKFTEWSQSYKEKLNKLELWNFRAKLEIDERKTFKVQPEMFRTSRCGTCGAVLSSQVQEGEGWSEKDFGKKFISICDNCPGNSNNLCCSVCLLPYLTFSVSQFDQDRSEDWFVWCESCNHAGHAEHLSSWFAEYRTCPVVGCKCHCDLIT